MLINSILYVVSELKTEFLPVHNELAYIGMKITTLTYLALNLTGFVEVART